MDSGLRTTGNRQRMAHKAHFPSACPITTKCPPTFAPWHTLSLGFARVALQPLLSPKNHFARVRVAAMDKGNTASQRFPEQITLNKP